jgi:hypothetical protein
MTRWKPARGRIELYRFGRIFFGKPAATFPENAIFRLVAFVGREELPSH